MLLSNFLTAGLLSVGMVSGAGVPVMDTLQAVTVTADKGRVVSRTDTLSVRYSNSVSDVLHQNPGLHVGDNGGFAGLKSVNLRGMGSAQTSIYLDGVRVGNVQSGQGDLGMLPFEVVGTVVVDYAQNSVLFKTERPSFNDCPVAGKVRMSVGSFGTYQPGLRLDFRLNDKLALTANAAAVLSKGDFRYGDGNVRVNNDIRQVRGGLDLWGDMPGGDFHVKTYFNTSDRGTPGMVSWPSDDRQSDKNAFLQATVKKIFTPFYTLNLSAKSSYDDVYYSSQWGDSRYAQTELQLNSSHDFNVRSWWELSLAADLQWDGLSSDNYEASRLTAFSAIASSFTAGRFAADLAVEYCITSDKSGMKHSSFSPSVDLRYNLLKGLDVVAFARRAYRVPVFNELYYVGYGNPSLSPEDAWLTDLGLDYHRDLPDFWSVRAKLDAYYNRLKDKITSAPSPEDPNIWQPYNIGRVRSAGFDLMGGFEYSGEWKYSFNAKYSYQSAIDLTPDSYSYGLQIPYIARHTVILDGSVRWKGWGLNPLWQLRAGRTDGTGDIPAWNTLDIHVSKSLSFNGFNELRLQFSAKNIFDKRYEVVSGYPMPGRNFLVGAMFKF